MIEARNKERLLKVVWQEGGGPSVTKPKVDGLGSAFIDGAFNGAQVQREFRPEGFVCTIQVALPEAAEHGADRPV